jgi:hypothetical protein
MLEVKEIEIRGARFQLTPMDPFKAKKCDIKVAKVVVPVLLVLKGMTAGVKPSLDSPRDAEEEEPADVSPVPKEEEDPLAGLDPEMLVQALTMALGELDDSDQLFKDLFAGVVWISESDDQANGAPSQLLLDSTNAISKAFRLIGEGPTMFYRLAFEVARFNKFSPFSAIGGGAGTPGTSGLQKLFGTKGLDLAKLGG